jgi:hypothetical protein
MWAIPMVYKVRNALLQRSLRVTSRLAGTLPLPLMSNILNRQVAQFLEIRSAANARHSALQAESRWPAVRASGAGVSERQIRLGIRTARALADELPAAAAENFAQPSSVENAFAAGVGSFEPIVQRSHF